MIHQRTGRLDRRLGAGTWSGKTIDKQHLLSSILECAWYIGSAQFYASLHMHVWDRQLVYVLVRKEAANPDLDVRKQVLYHLLQVQVQFAVYATLMQLQYFPNAAVSSKLASHSNDMKLEQIVLRHAPASPLPDIGVPGLANCSGAAYRLAQ